MRKKIVLLLILMGSLILSRDFFRRAEQTQATYTMKTPKELPLVVLDAGHGGKDPGKVGVNDVLEKDINLSIALRLKSLLEQNDVVVVLTREEDRDLASEGASNRKNEDMKARVKIVEENSPVLMVSIHQNSFSEAEVDGAQTFYYAASEEGKQLAGMIQKSLKREVDEENHRVAKANKEYYLLKKAMCPAVIVECGFLSNPTEAASLASGDYQEKLAFAVHLGIMEYINNIRNAEK